jgi:hypothetical protein
VLVLPLVIVAIVAGDLRLHLARHVHLGVVPVGLARHGELFPTTATTATATATAGVIVVVVVKPAPTIAVISGRVGVGVAVVHLHVVVVRGVNSDVEGLADIVILNKHGFLVLTGGVNHRIHGQHGRVLACCNLEGGHNAADQVRVGVERK